MAISPTLMTLGTALLSVIRTTKGSTTSQQTKAGPDHGCSLHSAPDLQSYVQGQLHCAAQANVGPTLPSTAAVEGQGQLFSLMTLGPALLPTVGGKR